VTRLIRTRTPGGCRAVQLLRERLPEDTPRVDRVVFFFFSTARVTSRAGSRPSWGRREAGSRSAITATVRPPPCGTHQGGRAASAAELRSSIRAEAGSAAGVRGRQTRQYSRRGGRDGAAGGNVTVVEVAARLSALGRFARARDRPRAQPDRLWCGRADYTETSGSAYEARRAAARERCRAARRHGASDQ